MRYWKECATCYPVATELAQATLSLALTRGCILGPEATSLMEDIHDQTEHLDKDDNATSSVIVDFELAMSSKEESRSKALADRFDDLILFGDFTENV